MRYRQDNYLCSTNIHASKYLALTYSEIFQTCDWSVDAADASQLFQWISLKNNDSDYSESKYSRFARFDLIIGMISRSSLTRKRKNKHIILGRSWSRGRERNYIFFFYVGEFLFIIPFLLWSKRTAHCLYCLLNSDVM